MYLFIYSVASNSRLYFWQLQKNLWNESGRKAISITDTKDILCKSVLIELIPKVSPFIL